MDAWQPKTETGRQVKDGIIKDIDEVLDSGKAIFEAQIVEVLLPTLETDLLLIGQSKGKFGGGARRVFKQTQKKTMEGNKPKFSTYAVVGDRNGHVGLGFGKAKETVPAREKAIRNAKLNIIKIRRGSGSWEDNDNQPHSIPFKVTGKCGSVEITLIPAPPGKGLIIEKECKKLLELAGIQDVWSHTIGQTKTKTNLLEACFDALKQLMKVKVSSEMIKQNNIVDGSIAKVTVSEE